MGTRVARGLVTVSEAARRLGVSRPTVHAWVAKGKLTGETVSDRLAIYESSVAQCLVIGPDAKRMWNRMAAGATK